MTDLFAVQAAYRLLLLLPLGGRARHLIHPSLCNLRDSIAIMTGAASEEVQIAYETQVADIIAASHPSPNKEG